MSTSEDLDLVLLNNLNAMKVKELRRQLAEAQQQVTDLIDALGKIIHHLKQQKAVAGVEEEYEESKLGSSK